MKDHTYLKSFSIIHRFSIMYHIKALKDFRISGHQMGYMMHICREPGVSQEKLASYLGLNKGSVAKGIRPLIQEGYIDRIPNEKDKRAYRLFPTEKAKELFDEAEKTVASFNEILTGGMSEDEKEIFERLVKKACDNVMEAAGDDRHHLDSPIPPGGGKCRADCRSKHPLARQKGD